MSSLNNVLGKFLAWALLGAFSSSSENQAQLPRAIAEIQEPALKESSGLTRSQKVPERFWSLNDSGNASEIYAVDVDGNALATVKIEGVKNVDWEAIEVDGEGGIWIGDFGNNLNKRKDLRIYRVDEPGEAFPFSLVVRHTIHFRYPDQRAFPPEKMNFDCEAMFLWEKKLYLLSKHRSDRDTKLYRIEDLESDEVQTASLLGRFEWIGQVTDAALSSDGMQLAVLTYSGVWVFNRPEASDNFLKGAGKVWKFPNWSLKQVEGISWLDEKTLLICNEQRALFTFPVDSGAWEPFSDSGAQSGDELR